VAHLQWSKRVAAWVRSSLRAIWAPLLVARLNLVGLLGAIAAMVPLIPSRWPAGERLGGARASAAGAARGEEPGRSSGRARRAGVG
jgi:hypothetical protein